MKLNRSYIYFMLAWLGLPGPTLAQEPIVYNTQESYEQVKENLEFAITNQGLLISGVLKVAYMLDNTRKDLGYESVLLQGDSFYFCSAQHTYAMIAADPRNIVNCPFSVAVYVTLDEPDVVYVAYRPPQILGPNGEQATSDLAKLLDTIARNTVEE